MTKKLEDAGTRTMIDITLDDLPPFTRSIYDRLYAAEARSKAILEKDEDDPADDEAFSASEAEAELCFSILWGCGVEVHVITDPTIEIRMELIDDPEALLVPLIKAGHVTGHEKMAIRRARQELARILPCNVPWDACAPRAPKP